MRFKILLLILGLILTACGTQEIQKPLANQRMTNLNEEEVVAFIGVPFPINARNIYTIGDSALDTMVAARFDLDGDDVQAYLGAIGITAMPITDYSPFVSHRAPYSEATEWWDIVVYGEESDLSYAGVDEFFNGKNYNILIINPNSETATIYIQVHNT